MELTWVKAGSFIRDPDHNMSIPLIYFDAGSSHSRVLDDIEQ